MKKIIIIIIKNFLTHKNFFLKVKKKEQLLLLKMPKGEKKKFEMLFFVYLKIFNSLFLKIMTKTNFYVEFSKISRQFYKIIFYSNIFLIFILKFLLK